MYLLFTSKTTHSWVTTSKTLRFYFILFIHLLRCCLLLCHKWNEVAVEELEELEEVRCEDFIVVVMDTFSMCVQINWVYESFFYLMLCCEIVYFITLIYFLNEMMTVMVKWLHGCLFVWWIIFFGLFFCCYYFCL